MPLNDQNVPEHAVFVLKKTGLVLDAEQIAPDEIYDNHFLYVQVLPYDKQPL